MGDDNLLKFPRAKKAWWKGLLVSLFCALLFVGCAGDTEERERTLCDTWSPGCVYVSFATLDSGTTIRRANDLDNTMLGIQYNIRLKLDKPLLGGSLSLERGGYPVSLSVLPTHDFTNIVFGSYTLITGPNELVASLYNGAGTLVDRISITVYIE